MTAPRGAPPTVPRERTSLAWQRTALSALALGVALLRLGVSTGSAPQVVAAAVALVAAVALAAAPLARGTPARWRTVRPRVLALVTVCVVAGGVLAIAGALGV